MPGVGRDEVNLAVVTNDIYTTEDADFLRRSGVLDAERIMAVETGCCPHTAIRDDIAANLEAVDHLEATFPNARLILVESGGDNLTATFSRGLVDRQVFVVDVAGGDKVPRKGGPGVTRSDLLVINKVDLAPLVGADLSVMARDAGAVRAGRPVAFMSLRTGEGFGAMVNWTLDWLGASGGGGAGTGAGGSAGAGAGGSAGAGAGGSAGAGTGSGGGPGAGGAAVAAGPGAG